MGKVKFLFIIAVMLGVVFFLLRGGSFALPDNIVKLKQDAAKFIETEIQKEISAPPPLRAKEEAPQSFLTRSGALSLTNEERIAIGLPPLSERSELDLAARLKAQDMFQNQYFAHTAPSGNTAGDLADETGYAFIAIGENLALGNFKNDKTLVQAWMDSPGHRANILNSRYTEIGVAVQKGIFEGKSTWLAVQIFGKPLSDCPGPNAALKSQIEIIEDQLDQLSRSLAEKKAGIDAAKPKRGPEYNQKVDEYNALVAEYNNLIAGVKTLIADYNQTVQLFNACAQQ